MPAECFTYMIYWNWGLVNPSHSLRIASKPRLEPPASNPLVITSPVSTWMEIRRFSQANGGTLIWLEYWERYDYRAIVYRNMAKNAWTLFKCKAILGIVSLLLNTTQIGTNKSCCLWWMQFGCVELSLTPFPDTTIDAGRRKSHQYV